MSSVLSKVWVSYSCITTVPPGIRVSISYIAKHTTNPPLTLGKNPQFLNSSFMFPLICIFEQLKTQSYLKFNTDESLKRRLVCGCHWEVSDRMDLRKKGQWFWSYVGIKLTVAHKNAFVWKSEQTCIVFAMVSYQIVIVWFLTKILMRYQSTWFSLTSPAMPSLML